MATVIKTSAATLDWQKSFLWLAGAVACFHAAYTSIKYPAAGLFIFGYAFGLIQLTDQPGVRRAFYFGLAAGFLCYGPQLYFFWHIFNVAAIVLWLVLSFWVGLFTAIVAGAIQRWGKARAWWLIPFVWTGIEYFRSGLYYLKFSWLNIGYALPNYPLLPLFCYGMYGIGFLLFAVASFLAFRPQIKPAYKVGLLALLAAIVVKAHLIQASSALRTYYSTAVPQLSIVGIQMEFPPPNLIPKILDQALAKNPDAPIFVLSEYTLDGPVPDSLKTWCREHSRFLVVGGKDPAGLDNFYDTAFVVGTNGEIVFKQVKSVPIQFFRDGLPAPEQKLWNSPWGRIGICVCYDLSYTRVTDELIRQGAQMIIVPTMDVLEWGRHQHELHYRVAPVRAAEYGVPIFRLASSGISEAVNSAGRVVAQTPVPGNGSFLVAQFRLPMRGALPPDRWLAPFCSVAAGVILFALLCSAWREKPAKI